MKPIRKEEPIKPPSFDEVEEDIRILLRMIHFLMDSSMRANIEWNEYTANAKSLRLYDEKMNSLIEIKYNRKNFRIGKDESLQDEEVGGAQYIKEKMIPYKHSIQFKNKKP